MAQQSAVMVAVLAVVAATARAADVYDPKDCTSFPCLIFEDNFDFLDHNVWQHEITAVGGGNGEFQTYVNNRSISYTRDGLLFIKPDLTSNWRGEEFLYGGDLDLWGMNGVNDVCTSNLHSGCRTQGTPTQIVSPTISARLRTLDDFNFKYGRVEVRAKMPRADWMWPAIWLNSYRLPYGAWPASGEIDILEVRSNDVYGYDNKLSNMWAGTTMHWAPYGALNSYSMTHQDYQSPLNVSFADEFHTWSLEWNDDHIRATLNDVEVLYVDPGTDFFTYGRFRNGTDNPWVGGGKMAPFDQQMYLILNVAVGGTNGYFPDTTATPPKPWMNSSPQAKLDFWNGKSDWYPSWTQGEVDRTSEMAAMQVDYVRVYKMTNQEM